MMVSFLNFNSLIILYVHQSFTRHGLSLKKYCFIIQYNLLLKKSFGRGASVFENLHFEYPYQIVSKM